MTKALLITAAILLAVGLLIPVIGLLLPKSHVARAEALVAAPPDRVAALIRDVEGQTRWRGGVERIEVLERRPDGLLYVEHGADGAIRFDFTEETPGRQFRSVIADPDLPFAGAWTIALEAQGGGTLVTIEEQGSVSNPIFRFFSAFVFGHDKVMKAWLADLGKEAARGRALVGA